MKLQLDLQKASAAPTPEEDDIRRWIEAALQGLRDEQDTEITVRIVDSAEMTALNGDYRHKSGDTNVLSFAADLPVELALPLLGDIVICASVVAKEADEQNKPLQAHWAHLVVHGTLHLLGYDHIIEEEAVKMETLETAILSRLDYPCPYTGKLSEEHSRT